MNLSRNKFLMLSDEEFNILNKHPIGSKSPSRKVLRILNKVSKNRPKQNSQKIWDNIANC